MKRSFALFGAALALALCACSPPAPQDIPSAEQPVAAPGISISDSSTPAEAVAVREPIDIIDPWAAPTPGGVTTGGGYLSIVNNQTDADSLIGAASPRAGRVSLHEMQMDGAIMRMREIRAIEIPAGQRIDLVSGRYHLMFEDVHAPFVEGEMIAVTLTFRRRGEVEVEFPVQRGVGHLH